MSGVSVAAFASKRFRLLDGCVKTEAPLNDETILLARAPVWRVEADPAASSRAARHSLSSRATSAWLNVTFWLGMAGAAPVAGFFLAKADYQTPLFIAAGAMLAASLLNEFFFKRMDQPNVELSPVEV